MMYSMDIFDGAASRKVVENGTEIVIGDPRTSKLIAHWRSALFAELPSGGTETWVDLGLHPHLAQCFYVREIEGAPRIFIDWVSGGTVKEALRDGRCANLLVSAVESDEGGGAAYYDELVRLRAPGPGDAGA